MLLDFKNEKDLSSLRKNIIKELDENGWPTRKNESWKFTNLEFLNQLNFKVTINSNLRDRTERIKGHNLFFSSGINANDIKEENISNLKISNLDFESKQFKDILGNLPSDHLISNLAIGYMTSCYLVEINEGSIIKEPIILNFLDGEQNYSSHPIIFFKINKNSQVSIAEISNSLNGLNSPFIIYDIHERSIVNFLKFQNDGEDTIHLGHSNFILDKKTLVKGFIFSKGAKLARIEANSILKGKNANFLLSAIYYGKEKQHHDITTFVHHDYENCISNQVIRGVLDDHSKGVFQGKVKVSDYAQKTDGQQMCKSLLLSRNASVNNKPELEIYADDVICTHGATVGEIDKNMIFYLCSRGLSFKDAKLLLIKGFVLELIENISFKPFKKIVLEEIDFLG